VTQSFALDFRVNPYVILSSSGVSDGTTAPQIIGGTYGSNYARHIHPEDSRGWFAEPNEAQKAGTISIDGLSRLYVWCERTGVSTGAWTYSLAMGRGPTGKQSTIVVPAGIVERKDSWVASVGPLVTDSAFPADFLSHPTTDSPATSDEVNYQLTVTPGNAAAEQISFFGLLCRPPQGSSSNRGNAVGPKVR